MIDLESVSFGVSITLHDNHSENYITTLCSPKVKYGLKADLANSLIYITKEGSNKVVVVPMANVRRFIIAEGANEQAAVSGDSSGTKKKASSKA